MAEIASAYPTAGGLYFWATKLGGVGWGWVTAWFNMLGQITITAGIDISVAIYGVGMFVVIFGIDPATPVLGGLFGWTVTSWGFYVFMMIIFMIPQVLINIYGIKLTAILNDFSVYWHIGGVLIIAALLTFFGKHHQPFSFAMQYVNTVNPHGRFDRGRLPTVRPARRSSSARWSSSRRSLPCSRGWSMSGRRRRFALVVPVGLPAGAVDLYRL